MATAYIDAAIRHLRRAASRQDAAGRTDGQLVTDFVEHKDEAAFEALLHRHGPMVWGVCRRIVGHHHEAEDAFQATFLILARKASSVRPRRKVANWLHGVALRTAMKAKALTAKRRGRERQVTAMPEPEAIRQDPGRDLQPLLDRELNALPENYRLPILLCDLEGRTIKEAAGQLGWPQGTVAGRLARGRKLLVRRLASRGVVLSAGSVGAALTQDVASAGVPASLMSSTLKAASVVAAGTAVAGVVSGKVASLTEGVMKAMLITKLKALTAVLLVVAAVGGGALLARSTTAAAQTADERLPKEAGEQRPDQQPPRAAGDDHPTELRTRSPIFGVGVNSDAGLTGSVVLNERDFNTGVGPDVNGFQVGGDLLLLNSLEYQIPVPANDQVYVVPFVDGGTVGPPPSPADSKAVAPRTDLERLQGVWSVVSMDQAGSRSEAGKAVFLVDGKRACWQAADSEMQGGLYLDPAGRPKRFDLATSTRTIEGVYSLEDDMLRLCYDLGPEGRRPGGLTTEKGSQQVLMVLKRTHGPEAFPFRLADGTRAFPTVIAKDILTEVKEEPTGRLLFGAGPKLNAEERKLQGTWRRVAGFHGRCPNVPGVSAGDIVKSTDVVIDGTGWIAWTAGGKRVKVAFRADLPETPGIKDHGFAAALRLFGVRPEAVRAPKGLDVQDVGGDYVRGIYGLSGDDLVIRLAGSPAQARPGQFAMTGEDGVLLLYKRGEPEGQRK